MNWSSTSDHERASRFASFGVSALAAAACLYLLVRIAWLLVPQAPLSAGTPAPAASVAAPAVSVAKWHLFGNPQALAPAARSSLATVLKLGLRGTLALPDPKDERAIAIIVNEQGVETSYRIGAEVAPGAKLAEVYADHVVIDHAGVAESLALPRPDQHSVPLPERNQQRLSGVSPASHLPSPHPTSAAPAAASAGAGAHVDPQEFARQIRPVISGGRIVGADISGADAGLLARVGLKPSDVVTAVNGTRLADVSNPQALFEQLQNSASIQVTVQRDGKPATLTLSLR